MRGALLLLALALPGLAAAQGLYKCRDAAGKITYAGRECAQMGLKDAGEIRDVMSSSPALPVPKPKPEAAPPPPSQAAAPAKAEEKKAEDERRCFKTAKGYRCNDKPEEK